MIEMVRLYRSGQSISQLAARFDVSKTTIHKKLRQHIILRPAIHRTHQINIVNLINYQTESCAYWLGYLARKGNFQRTRISIQLPMRDIRHLGKLAGALQSSLMPIKKDKRCRLAVNHADLVRFYQQNGVSQFKIGDPTCFPQVNARHLLRGLWDSGGIVTHNSRYLRMGFSSRYQTVLEYISKLLLEIGVIANHVDEHGKSYLWWCGKPALTIAKYLYFNQTVSLDRNTSKVLNYILVQK